MFAGLREDSSVNLTAENKKHVSEEHKMLGRGALLPVQIQTGKDGCYFILSSTPSSTFPRMIS